MSVKMQKSKFIWFNGKFVKWDDAKTHVLSHALHYGSGAFEGIRCYNTEKGPAIFRLKEHIDRLYFSADFLGLKIPYTENQIKKACVDVIRKNKLPSAYIRPI